MACVKCGHYAFTDYGDGKLACHECGTIQDEEDAISRVEEPEECASCDVKEGFIERSTEYECLACGWTITKLDLYKSRDSSSTSDEVNQ